VAERQADALHLTVADSGGGFGGRARPPRERIGIGGTRARLHLLFGEEARLEFSYPDEGFAVRVVIPAVEAVAEETADVEGAHAG
jgi:signal transduction histidine kinase